MSEKVRYPDDAAFPVDFSTERGLTVRGWYAGLAMQGLLASNTGDQPWVAVGVVAKLAFDYADAMIRAGSAGPD